jgi:hypothetical protein
MSYCDKLRQRAVTSYDGLLRQNTGKRWRFHKESIDEWMKKRDRCNGHKRSTCPIAPLCVCPS